MKQVVLHSVQGLEGVLHGASLHSLDKVRGSVRGKKLTE